MSRKQAHPSERAPTGLEAHGPPPAIPRTRSRLGRLPNALRASVSARLRAPLKPPVIPPIPTRFLGGDNEDESGEAASHCYRTIWLSDIHLGAWGCRAEDLLDFLRVSEADTIYLVGDIVDCWRLRRSWYWPQAHNDVVQKLLRKVRKGTRIIYVPGNHDEVLRDYAGLHFGGVLIQPECLHDTADGRRLLVMHGDQFDGIMHYARWLAFVGDWAYHFALVLNVFLNRARRHFGLPYWSLSAYLKHRVKNAVAFISKYEEAIAFEARRRGVDGIVCGHIHHAEIRTIDGVLYCNDGDWVESCTALVEHFDGRLEIVRWAETAPVTVAASQPAFA